MLFNSLHYLIFFPLVIFIFFVLPQRVRWILLLISSYYFYMCWKLEYVFLIIFSTLIDYFVSHKIYKQKEKSEKKRWLYLSLISNIGILIGFKYLNFINDNIQSLFNKINIFYEIPLYEMVLPVGISFYTFQTLSYTIDVYNQKTKPQKHLGVFAVFVSFFPQLVAGPIERSSRLLPQFFKKHDFNYKRVRHGLQRILWGFFKKVVIADRLAIIVDAVYNNPESYSGIVLIIATVFFAFQIYCDFSGYSDIAIGSAKVLGFELVENFKRPYFSKSISQFWKRWHISLSSWFKDYLYIPLGGNRVMKWKWYYNLFITFLISGLWHGANWTFVIWGGLHGSYLIFSIITKKYSRYLKRLFNLEKTFINKLYNIFSTFILVSFAWIFFRANNTSDAFYIVSNLFNNFDNIFNFDLLKLSFRGLGVSQFDFIVSISLIVFLEIYHLYERSDDVWKKLNYKPKIIRWSFYYLIIFCILFLAPYTQVNNFIYFQF